MSLKKIIPSNFTVPSILVVPTLDIGNSLLDLHIVDSCWKEKIRVIFDMTIHRSVHGGTGQSAPFRRTIAPSALTTTSTTCCSIVVAVT